MEKRLSRTRGSHDSESSEEETDSTDSNSSSVSSSSTSDNLQSRSSSEEESEEELCPAARLLICKRHQHRRSQKKVLKPSKEKKTTTRRKSSSNAGTQTFDDIDHANDASQIWHEEESRRKEGSGSRKKSKTKKNRDGDPDSKENFQMQTDFDACGEERSISRSSHSVEKQSRKSPGRMNSLFMQEKPIEEEEEDGGLVADDDDRPIRGPSSLREREDTMDGAEAPDHDPPQRRRTLEDISITELSARKSSLPPEFPEEESPPTLLPCVTCGRTFNPGALDRHRKVCQKIASTSKKKQVFNAHTQKFEVEETCLLGDKGGRAGTPERGSRGTSPAPQKNKKASRWREKHQEFLRTIRAARGAPEGDADAGAPGVPSDYVQCPVCGRHFGPKAADRHISWCKEQSTRLRNNAADAQLVERLKSRTKYVPPKPGQGGWRAPKKTDVISSIPPPATSDRRVSPPPLAPPRRGVSPGPLAQRRGVSPGPLSRQHSTASLGRAGARSVASLLQAVTAPYCSPYGQRSGVGTHSGYATPSSYSACGASGARTPSLTRSGSFSGSGGPQNFVRSGSLRVPSVRRSSGEQKARARDLASDMLASVCLGASPARGEPEGDEAENFSRETTLSPPPFSKSLLDSPFDFEFDSRKYEEEKYDPLKYDSAKKDSYDPYSAAEMQMQALLGPSFGQDSSYSGGRLAGLSAAGMGGGFDGSQASSRKHSTSPPPKDRLGDLKTPLSPGLTRSYRQTSPAVGQEGLSPTPSGEFFSEKRFWRRSPSPPGARDRWSQSPKSPSHAWAPSRSPGREERRSTTSLSGGSREGSSGATSRGLQREDRFSPSAARENRSLFGARKDLLGSDPNSPEGSFVRGNRLGSFGSGTNRSSLTSRDARYSCSGQRGEGNGAPDVTEDKSTRDDARASLKALRLALGGERRDGLLESSGKHERKSSASSSDSSLPPLTSSGSSLSPTTPKGSRENTVGGHGSLTTPRLSLSTSAEASNLNRDSSLSSISPTQTLKDAISSLSALGGGASLGNRYSSFNADTSKPASSSSRVSKYSNLNEFKKGAESKTAAPVNCNAPKFCYECGNKYPVTMAKFCCHCGSRRSAAN